MDLLDKVLSLENEASAFGFAWETSAQIMSQIHSECLEIAEHLHADNKQDALQEEIGDLLHAVFSLCVFCNFNPRDMLQQTLDKFERRLTAVKTISKEQGLDNLQGYSFDELMSIWKQAKGRVG